MLQRYVHAQAICIRCIKDAWSDAIRDGRSLKEINDRMSGLIFRTNAYKRLPDYCRSFIDGYHQASYDLHFQHLYYELSDRSYRYTKHPDRVFYYPDSGEKLVVSSLQEVTAT